MTNVNKYIGHLNKYITVIPLSSKAKNHLANQTDIFLYIYKSQLLLLNA